VCKFGKGKLQLRLLKLENAWQELIKKNFAPTFENIIYKCIKKIWFKRIMQ